MICVGSPSIISERFPLPLLMPQVRDAPLSAAQESLLLALERRVQVHLQAEAHAALLQQRSSASDVVPTVKDLLLSSTSAPRSAPPSPRSPAMDASFLRFSAKINACASQWEELFAHAHLSFALVEEMEASHAQVASKTQALYESFENVLQQVEALDARVEAIAAPMPHFIAIDGVAHALGFGVKFAPPSATSNASAATGKGSAPPTNAQAQQPAVQVFQHRRSVDPTAAAFDAALDKIDESVAFLSQHVRLSVVLCSSYVFDGHADGLCPWYS